MSRPNVYASLEPAAVWRHFAALNALPRPSGQEGAARDYVLSVARAAGAPAKVDAAGNAVVRVPASRADLASALPVAIQAHLDMVCEKRPEVIQDFTRDPIRPRREGNLVYASGTTLGADNGIGAALALALLDGDPCASPPHGPLELLFTVEEETGLFGAKRLDGSLLGSRRMINLDSEDPDELTVGCAGGAGTTLSLECIRLSSSVSVQVGREIVVSGLAGGHSGVQIHEPLANAIKILATVLHDARCRLPYARRIPLLFHLVSIDGGSAHNAIPRDASAVVVLHPHMLPRFESEVEAARAKLVEEWHLHEPGLRLEYSETALPASWMTQTDSDAVIRLLRDLPHGVLKMSEQFEGKVETSANLAEVHTNGDTLEVAISVRSFRAAEIERVQAEIAARGKAAEATVQVNEGYPGWEPNPDSRLLLEAKEAYLGAYGKAPSVQVVHAGLECGVILDKLPGMEAISFGPLIRGAHTPEENVEITSVATTWGFLGALLERLAAG